MPISFDAPAILAPNLSYNIGLAEAENRRLDRFNQIATFGGYLSRGQVQSDTAGQQDRAMEADAYHMLGQSRMQQAALEHDTAMQQQAIASRFGLQEQHYQQQLGLQEAQLNMGERIRLQQLQQAESAIEQQRASGELTDAQANEYRQLVRTPRMLLEQRDAMARVRQHEMQVQEAQRVQALRTALTSSDQSVRAQAVGQMTYTDPDTGNAFYVNPDGTLHPIRENQQGQITPQLYQSIRNNVQRRADQIAGQLTAEGPAPWGTRTDRVAMEQWVNDQINREVGAHQTMFGNRRGQPSGQGPPSAQQFGWARDIVNPPPGDFGPMRRGEEAVDRENLNVLQRQSLDDNQQAVRDISSHAGLTADERREGRRDLMEMRNLAERYGSLNRMPTAAQNEFRALAAVVRRLLDKPGRRQAQRAGGLSPEQAQVERRDLRQGVVGRMQ